MQAVDHVVRKFEHRGEWYSVSLLVSMIEREEVSTRVLHHNSRISLRDCSCLQHPAVAWLSEAFTEERRSGIWCELLQKLLIDLAKRVSQGEHVHDRGSRNHGEFCTHVMDFGFNTM